LRPQRSPVGILGPFILAIGRELRRALLRYVADPDHKTLATPKLNIVAVNESFSFLDCLDIVGAFHGFIPDEMSINADRVRPVVNHLKVPCWGEHITGLENKLGPVPDAEAN
jgi:hypothetical protein